MINLLQIALTFYHKLLQRFLLQTASILLQIVASYYKLRQILEKLLYKLRQYYKLGFSLKITSVLTESSI